MSNQASEKSYTRIRSKTTTSIVATGIYLDFNDDPKSQRRSSFLPQDLAADDETVVEDRKFSKVITFCGASFVTPQKSDPKGIIKFVTGSKYMGQWNELGITGKGVYKYPHGVIYDGHFNRTGEFHGSGILTYPNGQRLEGFWRNGMLSPGANFVTPDNTLYNEDYCRMPDRRFQIEVAAELQPADQENLTNARPLVAIPDGCYDSGDGFYDPILKVIRSYINPDVFRPIYEFEGFMTEERHKIYNLMLHPTHSEHDFIRQIMRWTATTKHAIESIPKLGREQWIKRRCRRAWSEPTGYKPELYELWTTGARKYANQPLHGNQNENYRGDTTKSSFINSMPFDAQLLAVAPDNTSLGIEDSNSGKQKSNSLQVLSAMFIQGLGSTQNNIISFCQYPNNTHGIASPSSYSTGSKSRKAKHSTLKHGIRKHMHLKNQQKVNLSPEIMSN